MTCRECELRLASGDERQGAVAEHLLGCAECRAMQREMEENALALSALREETVPPRTRRMFPWLSVAAAAAIVAMVSVQVWQWRPVPPAHLRLQAERPEEITVAVKAPPLPAIARAQRRRPAEPLKIKMLTDNPDVVVYWLVDSKEGD